MSTTAVTSKASQRDQLLVALTSARDLAVRTGEFAEEAYADVAALDRYVCSAYFNVDGVALRALDADRQAKILQLVETIVDARKHVDRYQLLEVLRAAEELHTIADDALSLELRHQESGS